jgi:flagellar biosynthesis protein FliR
MTLETLLLILFAIFCRVAGCLMIAPGFSNQRIPIRIRLYAAIGVCIVIAPSLTDTFRTTFENPTLIKTFSLVFSETGIGMVIGTMARMFILALESMAMAIVTSIGLGNIFSPALMEDEMLPALATFISFGSTALIFATDQHLDLIQGLLLSYDSFPLLSLPETGKLLSEFSTLLEKVYTLAVRISSPFLLLGLVTNLAFGFLNRMVPNVPVYFISVPFLIGLGGYWFCFAATDFFAAFSSEFGAWLRNG